MRDALVDEDTRLENLVLVELARSRMNSLFRLQEGGIECQQRKGGNSRESQCTRKYQQTERQR
jgi:hypothetical protein